MEWIVKLFRPRIRKRNVKSKKQKNSSSTYINNLNISENYVQNGRFSSHLNGKLKGCIFQIAKNSMLVTDFEDLKFWWQILDDWFNHKTNSNVRIYQLETVTKSQKLSPAISCHYLDVNNISLTHFCDPFILQTITA